MENHDKLLNAIDAYAENAHGGDTDGGELSRQRALALDAFAGKNIEPAPEGRSQITDRCLFDTINWLMPSLMRIFASGDNIVEFEAQGPEDEEVAEQESDYLNYLVTQKNDWDVVARTWMQDALLTKNAYVYCYLEEKIQTELERYEGQTEEQVAYILDDDVEVVGQRQYEDEDDEGTVIHPLTGEPAQDEAQLIEALALYESSEMEPQIVRRMLFDLEVRRTQPVEQLRFKVLPPERVKVAQDTPDFTLEDCDYFEYWDKCTISDLRRMGYDIPDDISDDYFYETEEDRSRDEVLEADIERDLPDPSMRQVVCRWIWIAHDTDEDGIAELQYVVRVGRRVLALEPVTSIPVACIVPYINTHRHMGQSVADLIFDIQRIRTALLRGGLDGLNLALNPRHYVNLNAVGSTTIDDLLISRPGGVVRGEGIPGEAIMPLQSENTFPYALEGLSFMDSIIESRVGVNKMFQGIDANAMSSTNAHNAIGQLSTMAAQRVEDIARVFGCGFKRLFKIAHELIIRSGHSAQAIKLRGEWVNIDPTQWKTGRDMRVVAPFAAGNKDALLNRLMILKQIHAEALAGGLPIVTAEDSYELALEIAKATDVSGEKFFTDPNMIEPPPEEPDYNLIALEIENKKVEQKDREAETDADLDKYKADLDAEVEKYKADIDAEVKRLIAQANQETQVLLAQLKAGQQIDLEQVKAKLKDDPLNKIRDVTSDAVSNLNFTVAESIEAVSDALSKMREEASAPIKIVRENGKIVGKEVNGRFIPVEGA